VPVRVAYDQWTRYEDFSSFAKGVKSATTADDTSSDWKLKVFWSTRSWKAHTTQQLPDHRLSWTTEGAKGTTKGVVTFHSLGDNLTRVCLVMEYYPKGLFERTGNIWRAQGRRARLDLKNYARHISMKGDIDDGWRGTIEDGEVVKTHEDALAEEEEARAEEEGHEDEEGHEGDDDRPEGEYDEEEAAEDGDEEHDPEAEYEEEGEEDHDPEAEYDEEDAEEEDEPEAEYEEEGEPEAEEEQEEEDPEAEYEDAELVEDDEDDADTRKQREYADSGDKGHR
jgi:hypothetical protein